MLNIQAPIPKEIIVQQLKDKGLRVTPQRYSVYASLLHRQDHPTAEQILKDLNVDGPRSSQATVYSALQALQEVGLVRDILLESGVCRYDANIAPHHHFRCQTCGAIVDIPWHYFGNLDLSGLVPNQQIQAESYEVTVKGICGHCQDSGRCD